MTVKEIKNLTEKLNNFVDSGEMKKIFDKAIKDLSKIKIK